LKTYDGVNLAGIWNEDISKDLGFRGRTTLPAMSTQIDGNDAIIVLDTNHNIGLHRCHIWEDIY